MGFAAFGKIPAVGDFFRLNAPAGFVSVWDGWIQNTMLVAQQALGGEWDAHYMSAPIWRFSLSAGLAGPHRIMGVTMPSVDRVGRRFPLTLMTPLPPDGPLAQYHFGTPDVFQAAETLALDSLEDGMTRDQLEQRLAGLTMPKRTPEPHVPGQGGGALAFCAATGSGMLAKLAALALADRVSTPSLWSAEVNGTERLLVCDGLPAGPQVQALFDMQAPLWSQEHPA